VPGERIIVGREDSRVPRSGVRLSREELAHVVDACVRDRVVVFGSLPPRGSDLDLLARAPELRAIAHTLTRAGFARRGLTWAHFKGPAVLSVDLVPAEQWDLDDAELQALFAGSDTIEGFSSLAAPAPHHEILIAARRAARAGTLDDRARERVGQALGRDPAAWGVADRRAPKWHARSAMRLLREQWRKPGGNPRALRAAARGELALSLARTGGGWWWLARRTLRSRRKAVVAFSGIDGAGKSFQANALRESLSDLGVEAFVVWPPAQNVLFQMPAPLKRVLRAALERAGSRDPRASADGSERRGGPPIESMPPRMDDTEAEPIFDDLPRQRPLVMHLLATVVALAQVLSFRKGERSAPAGSRVLIFDRYALDAIVYVRHRWSQGRQLRWPCKLIAAMARRPLRAYLLDVPPEVAYARKRDFPVENLRGRARLYSEHCSALGARRLDGQRPPAELREQIAREVWSSLR
jgi:thymidylate kinase